MTGGISLGAVSEGSLPVSRLGRNGGAQEPERPKSQSMTIPQSVMLRPISPQPLNCSVITPSQLAPIPLIVSIGSGAPQSLEPTRRPQSPEKDLNTDSVSKLRPAVTKLVSTSASSTNLNTITLSYSMPSMTLVSLVMLSGLRASKLTTPFSFSLAFKVLIEATGGTRL